jgi:cobalt-precorrin 5A hydrolase/precorrin-3B C17-methyltransferase
VVSRPAIVTITASARPLADRLAAALGGEVLNGPDHLATAFAGGRPVVALCATGIVIRKLSPHLADKRDEPPVVAVAEDGSTVVPLLGGHRGANALAHQIAAITGGHAAITTASDVRFGVALDAPPGDYVLANPEHHKAFAADLLAGATVRARGEAPWLAALPLSHEGRLSILVTEHAVPGGPRALVYHPKTLALGVGCERGTPPGDLIALVEGVLATEGLARQSLAGVFSLDLKADEAAVHVLARHLGVPARFFDAVRLNAETPRLKNPSETVRAETGCPGVAEGAALAAAGPDGELIVEKTKGPRATCAIARAPSPIVNPPGRARGSVTVVGLGPGGEAWRSPEAADALRAASDWVGYGLYLDLAADLLSGQREHRFPLGAEENRVVHAFAMAAEGRDVALVCSGDSQIYAMAALAAEVLDPASDAALSDAARRAELRVLPGISAFQAASARAGALIGHDFCCISLSDLLTPWEVIERRLHAAAQGDFVVAFYNPRSLKRTDQLARAIGILKPRRAGDTPVIVASNVGRPEERILTTTLDAFDPETVDMLTIVLVGSSISRTFARGDGATVAYTPRGYAKKRETRA